MPRTCATHRCPKCRVTWRHPELCPGDAPGYGGYCTPCLGVQRSLKAQQLRELNAEILRRRGGRHP